MTTAEIREYLDEYADGTEEELLLADGFEDAILGLVEGCGRPTVVCYDYDLCVECLMRQGMDEDDAHEWMSFNTMGAYMGKGTPMFLTNLRARSSPTMESEAVADEIEEIGSAPEPARAQEAARPR